MSRGLFCVSKLANMQVIAGTMTPHRIEEIAKASTIVLTRQEWYEVYLAAGNILP